MELEYVAKVHETFQAMQQGGQSINTDADSGIYREKKEKINPHPLVSLF